MYIHTYSLFLIKIWWAGRTFQRLTRRNYTYRVNLNLKMGGKREQILNLHDIARKLRGNWSGLKYRSIISYSLRKILESNWRKVFELNIYCTKESSFFSLSKLFKPWENKILFNSVKQLLESISFQDYGEKVFQLLGAANQNSFPFSVRNKLSPSSILHGPRGIHAKSRGKEIKRGQETPLCQTSWWRWHSEISSS